MFDNCNVNLRKNKGFLTYIPYIPIPVNRYSGTKIAIATHDASGLFTTMPWTPTTSCYVAYEVLLNVEVC